MTADPPTETPIVAIDPQVEFLRREIGGKSNVVAKHQATGKFFQLGPEEYRVVRLLDGKRTIAEITEQINRDGIKWEASEVADFVGRLIGSNLAAPVVSGAPAPSPAKKTLPWTQRLPGYLSLLISQRFPLMEANQLAQSMERRLGFVFSTAGMIGWSVLVLAGVTVVGSHHQDFGDELTRMFDPEIWMVLVVLWAVAKVIHEAGHAIAASHHGVRVGKMGMMFFLCAPLAYVDVTDAWKLKSRWSRVQIALGGVYFELAVAAVAALAWWFLPEGMTRHLAAQFVLIAGPATLLVNANPLLRLDGYYVISDLTEIPNLRMHGRRQLSGVMQWWILRDEQPAPLLTGWRRTFATCHAACSVVFQVVWMGGLIIGVSMWAKGMGLVIAFAAAMLWAVLPFSRWCYQVWISGLADKDLFLHARRGRLLMFASLVLLVVQYFAASTSPFARRVPVVVRFCDEQIARATADAFVRSVYVERGERVASGTLLLELDAPELRLERERKADELKIAELKSVQLRRQGDLSQSSSESGRVQSLRRQLAELDEQIAGLQIVATREGLLMNPLIESLEGRFVSKGDELLRVCDPNEKELLASISESDMQAYQNASKQGGETSVRLRGGQKLQAVPAPLRPRARRSLPHPALSAMVGGPLAVEPSPVEGESLRTVEPQLESLTKLDPITSVEVHAGQIGMMTIADNRSLVTRLIETMTSP
ncbi:MAG: site-2 protease family protein [Rubripirellula sp.]